MASAKERANDEETDGASGADTIGFESESTNSNRSSCHQKEAKRATGRATTSHKRAAMFFQAQSQTSD